ncbi:pro-opiomelanocortin-like [Mobula birostris]|uniref:pro-opiomelanocortin-like n=1 Tax=Mobula birostris TaxID=1983395 RepID=UPI003B2815C9
MWPSIWRGLLPLLFALWAVSANILDCIEGKQCHRRYPFRTVKECIDGCKVDENMESPIYPGNSQLQPIEENIRNYVMGHFRWNKFGKKRGNSTELSVSKRKDEGVRGRLVQVPYLDAQASKRGSEDMGTQFPKQNDKKNYTMEHFRWGKPKGRRRKPVRVPPTTHESELPEYMGPEVEHEESVNLDYPAEMLGVRDLDLHGDTKKDEKNYKMIHFRWGRGPKHLMYSINLEDMLQERLKGGLPEEGVKKDVEKYKFGHFHWSSPLKGRRYGGFMISSVERGQKPLLTFFRNVIIEDGQEAQAFHQ